jgi:DNA transformation protein
MPAKKPRPEPPESLRKLSAVLPVEWRPMFGGIGIYSEGIFFALISSQGPLYFRVDDATRPDYEKAGAEAFMPHSRVKSRAGARVAMPYWTVPEKVLARPATLRKWASMSLEAARGAREAKAKKATKAGSGARTRKPPNAFI